MGGPERRAFLPRRVRPKLSVSSVSVCNLLLYTPRAPSPCESKGRRLVSMLIKSPLSGKTNLECTTHFHNLDIALLTQSDLVIFISVVDLVSPRPGAGLTNHYLHMYIARGQKS